MTLLLPSTSFPDKRRDPIAKRKVIKNKVPGKSFVDIGGLWGGRGEMVTGAAAAGADKLCMADIQDPQEKSKWWQVFDQRCADAGVTGVHKQQLNICAPDAPKTLGQYDVVHCSGVMYHVPDLFAFVGNLLSVTNEFLILGSVTIPPRIETPEGTLIVPDSGALLVHTLDDRDRAILQSYFRTINPNFAAASLTNRAKPFAPDGTPAFGPWWWLFTPEFMLRLLSLYNVKITAHGPTGVGTGYVVVARHL